MISTIELKDVIPLKPSQIGSNILEKIIETLKNLFEGKILGRIDAFIIKIVDVNPNSINNGKIDDISASIIYEVEYTAIIFIPKKNEKINVKVINCNDLGIWCKLVDFETDIIECFCPKNYIKNFIYDEKQNEFFSKEKDLFIKEDSIINVNIVTSTINSNSIIILCEIS